jgi:hypothetical protein
VEIELPTTAELLEQWREATRAADLAERLAGMAAESVERSDRSAGVADEIAKMAQRAADSATRAATVARAAAGKAKAFADENRAGRLSDADSLAVAARADEVAARERYHEAERVAKERQGS